MRLLLIGGTGQVGGEIRIAAESASIECISPSSSELDITNKDNINKVFVENSRFDFVINASAYTAVDKAEDDPVLAFSVNRDGPHYVAEACAEHHVPLLHISTDYVFDGNASLPYTEDMAVHPLGIYGESKLEGEQAIRECLTEHIILRTAWVYGAQGNNFVKTMLRLGGNHQQLKVVSDQIGCPTSAVDIAKTIIWVIRQMIDKPNTRWGTYHYCSADHTNWADFAMNIFSNANKIDPNYPSVQVLPISTSEYPTRAVRPDYSVLDCSKIERAFSIQLPCWEMSLQRDIANILKNI